MNNLNIFDVDQHLSDLNICDWKKELPVHLIDKAPRNVMHKGVERLAIEDKLFPKPEGFGLGSPIGSEAGGEEVTIPKRLEWMDSVGVNKAILTPGNLGMAVHAIEDLELKKYVLNRYWRWQLEQADLAGDRGKVGLLVDPYVMPDKEILTDERLACLYIRPTNASGLHFWEEPLRNLLKTAAEYSLPIMLHSGTGYYQKSPLADNYDNYFYTHLYSHYIEIKLAIGELIGHGLFQEYNDLKVIFVEAGVSWVPSFIHHLQDHVTKLKHLVPGGGQDVFETLNKHSMFSVFNADSKGLKDLLVKNPWMKTAVGTDYPHWDTLDVSSILGELKGDLYHEVANKNATEFFSRSTSLIRN